uniref:ATP-sensitive inward rectifier potassium channel 10 n=1 Tax=mine drainage metagenome TaxID=410659 RepID=E6PTD2_9ZZZZ
MKARKNRPKEIDLTIGRSSVTKVIARHTDLHDLYPALLRLSWDRFLAVVTLAYLAVDILFALLYYAHPNAIGGTHEGRFASDFFFSAETLSTVGYGQMYPANLYGHVVATVESLTGMMLLAVVTGLIFVRFSRPWPRVMFARHAVIGKFNGKPTLMVRIGNEHDNMLFNVEVRMTLMLQEVTAEGVQHFSGHTLKLHNDHIAVFALAWMAMHEIAPDSPLHGLTSELLAARRMDLIVSVVGLDEVLTATVHAVKEYGAEDLRFDHHYVPMGSDDHGRRRVDFAHFHEVEPTMIKDAREVQID